MYWCKVSASFGAIAGSLLLLVCISLIVLILSCSLGWVVAKISLKLKNKSFATVLLSLVFIGVYYFFYFKAQTLLQELLLNAAVYGAKIRGAAYPLYLLGRMGEGDLAAILTVTAVVLALFALMWYMLSRSFLKIATATGKSDRKVYRETRTEKRSAFAALFSKELARFTGNPNYMLNCGLGTLFLPALGVFLLIKGSSFLGNISEFLSECPGALPVLLCAAHLSGRVHERLRGAVRVAGGQESVDRAFAAHRAVGRAEGQAVHSAADYCARRAVLQRLHADRRKMLNP